jgi:hypothetical protein
MPPVSGLLAPTERRPPFGAVVPPKRPGAKTSLASGPSASDFGGTSLKMIASVRARPTNFLYLSGTGSFFTDRSDMFTLRMLAMHGLLAAGGARHPPALLTVDIHLSTAFMSQDEVRTVNRGLG